MQKLEQAIRRALHKIDASSPALRQKVYESVWHAHEKSLAAEKQPDKTEKARRRAHLTRLIKTIEAGYHAPQGLNDQLDISPAAERSANPAAKTGSEEQDSTLATDPAMVADARPQHQHKHSWLPAGVLIFFLLAVTLFVVWSFFNSLTTADRKAGMRPSSITPMRQTDPEYKGWIQVFDPGNITTLAVRGSATAQIHNEEDKHFIRIRARKAGDAVIIEIGPGVLMKLRGKTATLNIMARSSGRKITQLSLTGDFGTGEHTRRHRFEISPTLGPLLFQVEIPPTINSPAKLYLSSDFSDSKSAVDIFSVLINTEN